ncbi:PREDICTED: condensin complex subunit 3 [Ficedula albicollis]|uniref:Non-SMC condensin I complex subunit G n=1 Tax=Ficedula albicollis TaxID=59894 RepID=A0A803VZ60_FICAL|nr:PREDICTED: condensin complex subunit 3 [Ficedula albicollis]XP_016153572.1 PREDICTED: condensin complex subunit 3 [Ficedula albicollis]
MGPKKKLLQVQEAFQLAQKPHQNHAKLMVALKSTYAQLDDKEGFNEKFIHCLKHAMIIYRREPAVEHVINFAARFVTSFYQMEKEDDSEKGEEDNLFLNYVFKFLLESHDANSNAVRFRTCQLVNKILGNLPENAEIDDDLFDKINGAMLIRLKDKFPSVRIQAVLALSRLQDPKDENCPVVNIYSMLLENDSNSDVRRAVLSCIAPSARTLPKIVGRTMDVKDAVRKLAYEVLAEKVHVRALTIAQRVKLLQQGLNDRSDAVKEVMKKKLLPAWLQSTEGGVLELLHRLDVENCPEVAISVLNAMFSLSSLHDIVQNCKNLDSRKLIPLEDLTVENVLYWRCLCEYLKSKGEEGEVVLEEVLPEPVIYADYLLSYLQNMPILSEEQKEDFNCFENLMTKEFIGQQLILIIGCMDTMEEGGRKHLLVILQKILILPSTSAALIPLLVERLLSIVKDEETRIQIVAEIISEVREPTVAVEQPVDAVEIRKRELKVAEIKVKLFEAKQALEECITLQDFNTASVLKEKITELEHTKNDLIKAAEQAEIKEIRVEKNDPETLLKCLLMCYEVLKIMSLSKGISPTINEIIQSLILPGVANVHPAVRNMAVLCLGCCTLQSKEFSQKQLPLLLQVLQIDNIKIKLSALKAIFDQLMLFGIEPFKTRRSSDSQSESAHIRTENDEEESETIEEKEETATVHYLLNLLSGFLDSEFSELRTEAAEGIAKLMFSGRLISAKLFSRLVLLWYNPVTEEDTRLRHCLGVFFPLFAYANRSNQECVEEAYLPTLQTLSNAPATSPLAEVDISNVSELLVDLTRPSGLKCQSKKSQDYQELTVHDTLAMKICNEILADPTAPDVRLYAKALNSLELTSSSTENLLVLLSEIQQKVKDKLCQRAIEKMQMKLTKDPNVDKNHSERTEETDVSERTQERDITLSENTAHNEEENNKDALHTPVNEVRETAKLRSARSKTGKGQRKVAEVRSVSRRKTGASVKRGLESGDQIPEPVPVSSSRPQRRAKTLALEKTRMNLSRVLSEEADE